MWGRLLSPHRATHFGCSQLFTGSDERCLNHMFHVYDCLFFKSVYMRFVTFCFYRCIFFTSVTSVKRFLQYIDFFLAFPSWFFMGNMKKQQQVNGNTDSETFSSLPPLSRCFRSKHTRGGTFSSPSWLAGWCARIPGPQRRRWVFYSPLFSLVLFFFNVSQPSSSSCLCVFPENDNPLYPPPPAYSPQPELNRNTLVPNVR